MCGKVRKLLENLSYFEKIIIKMLILSGKKFGIKGWEKFFDFKVSFQNLFFFSIKIVGILKRLVRTFREGRLFLKGIFYWK